MVSVFNYKRLFSKSVRIIYIIIAFVILTNICNFHHLFLSNNAIHWFQTDSKGDTKHNNQIDFVYHHDGIVYDYYSKNELRDLRTGYQWKTWPLPHEINHLGNDSSINTIETSPFVLSKLAFIDVIYIITNSRLTKRHDHLRKVFDRQGISMESVEWRMKWNQTLCNSNASHSYVYQRLNLKDKPLSIISHLFNSKCSYDFRILDKEEQRRCAITMEHVDVWYEIAKRKISLALILEDDAIFVPFLKEKFTRMIYTAIRSQALHINKTCVKIKEKNRILNDQWIEQNSMIVIGTCFSFHSQYFRKHLSYASPHFSAQKLNASRCSHAYLLTLCSSQALIDQIQEQRNDFYSSDFLQNYLFRLSSTLQSFWIDPPLVYQGNQIIDMDKIETFKIQTYK